MYLRARERRRQGSEVMQVQSAARFLWSRSGMPQAGEGGVFPVQAEQLICALRRSLPHDRGGEFASQISTILGDIVGLSAKDVRIALTDHTFCREKQAAGGVATEPLRIIHLDRSGTPISSNPVWNACIRGQGITAALIKSNTDKALYRSGHQRTEIPWSCRDYHKGPIDVWTHPDFPGLSIVLDDRGRLMSALPADYLAVKGGSIAESK
ncbi:MAG: hypothetical protein PHZ00_06860 [Candidatus Peribacteraceae bacterium]|nr:hypothetical protein [Candidatus Peribacteraceae bacterium]